MIPPEYLNQIVTGDARLLVKAIPDESIDLVLTDPPFGINFDYGNGYKDDPAEYEPLVKWIVKESNRIIKPGGLCFVFVAQTRLRHIWPSFPEDSRIFAACKNFVQTRPSPVQYAFDPVIFWQKEGQSLIESHAGRRDWVMGNTTHRKGFSNVTFHACPKPLNTMVYMVENFCPPGGLVVDFFMGSGTTAAAAKVLGCDYWGCEIDPATAEAARERVQNTQPPLFVLEPEQVEMELA